jgi:hypothetical protein
MLAVQRPAGQCLRQPSAGFCPKFLDHGRPFR